MIFWIENPEGRLKLYLQPETFFTKIPGAKTVMITQSSYGREFKKATHLFTNNLKFIPRPLDKRIGNTRDFRNSKRGYYKRAALPQELCEEVIKSSENIAYE